MDRNETGSPDRLLTSNEVADILRVSEPTVRRLIRERSIVVVRIRRTVRVESAEVARYIAAHRDGAGR
jgi:excisionase family DNA binding protein